MKKVFLLISSIFLLASCGTLGVVSSPTTFKDAGKDVNVTSKNINFFTLTPMNSHKESKLLLMELNKKCNDGVTNIRATTSSKLFLFLGFEKLQISGNCE